MTKARFLRGILFGAAVASCLACASPARASIGGTVTVPRIVVVTPTNSGSNIHLSAPLNITPLVISSGTDLIITVNRSPLSQTTGISIIDWSGFNLGGNGIITIHQPSVGTITVSDPIFTGGYYIVASSSNGNSQQVHVTAQGVNPDRLLAAAGRVAKPAFGDAPGKIVTTTSPSLARMASLADSGLLAFAGPSGGDGNAISATIERVALSTGGKTTADLTGDGLIRIALKNDARPGGATLSAAAANDIVSGAVNTSGLVRVASVSSRRGQIVLNAPAAPHNAFAGNSRKTAVRIADAGGLY